MHSIYNTETYPEDVSCTWWYLPDLLKAYLHIVPVQKHVHIQHMRGKIVHVCDMFFLFSPHFLRSDDITLHFVGFLPTLSFFIRMFCFQKRRTRPIPQIQNQMVTGNTRQDTNPTHDREGGMRCFGKVDMFCSTYDTRRELPW